MYTLCTRIHIMYKCDCIINTLDDQNNKSRSKTKQPPKSHTNILTNRCGRIQLQQRIRR